MNINMEAITTDIINAAIKSESQIQHSKQSFDSLERRIIAIEAENKQLKERISYLESIFLSKD